MAQRQETVKKQDVITQRIEQMREHAPNAAARADFAASKPATLTHADVSAWLDGGLALLIDLHAWAEQADADLDARIWGFLRRHTERHKLDF